MADQRGGRPRPHARGCPPGRVVCGCVCGRAAGSSGGGGRRWELCAQQLRAPGRINLEGGCTSSSCNGHQAGQQEEAGPAFGGGGGGQGAGRGQGRGTLSSSLPTRNGDDDYKWVEQQPGARIHTSTSNFVRPRTHAYPTCLRRQCCSAPLSRCSLPCFFFLCRSFFPRLISIQDARPAADPARCVWHILAWPRYVSSPRQLTGCC